MDSVRLFLRRVPLNRHKTLNPRTGRDPGSGTREPLSILYLVVSADIQEHRQTLLGFDPPTGRVQGQLPHGDAHAVAAQVAQTQNALAVRHHNSLDGDTENTKSKEI